MENTNINTNINESKVTGNENNLPTDEIIDDPKSKSNQVINKKRYREEDEALLKNNNPNTNKILVQAQVQSTSTKPNSKVTTESPYLGTIRRHLLDFDFEKVCSTSLSNLNVYACLVCGKYYQGRGTYTLAYSHSLEENHYMFINLSDQRIYTLPDGFEVINNSLNDIKFNLKPKFLTTDVENFDKNTKISKALDGTEYIPGCIGLNNLKKTDYFNVIIQTLCRIPKLRNFFLEYEDTTTDLKFDLVGLFVQRCGELFRKIWNSKNFKGHVNPHEMMQAVSLASNKSFKIIQQSDAVNYLTWFLNTVHNYLCKKNKSKSSIISECFQGVLKVETFTEIKEGDREKLNLDIVEIVELEGIRYIREEKIQNFLYINYINNISYLTLDLPKTPLFKNSNEKINIPQVSIFQIMKKYDGKTFTDDPIKGIRKLHHLIKLPKNLILCFKRFEKNLFFVEKNNTIVNFPIKNLSLEEFCEDKTINRHLKYDLLANVIHDGKPEGAGYFRVQVKNKALDQWFDIQDLNVTPIMAQSVVVSESYIHAYESQTVSENI